MGTSTTYTELSKNIHFSPFLNILLLSHLLISHPLLLSHYLALHSHLSHSLVPLPFLFVHFLYLLLVHFSPLPLSFHFNQTSLSFLPYFLPSFPLTHKVLVYTPPLSLHPHLLLEIFQ